MEWCDLDAFLRDDSQEAHSDALEISDDSIAASSPGMLEFGDDALAASRCGGDDGARMLEFDSDSSAASGMPLFDVSAASARTVVASTTTDQWINKNCPLQEQGQDFCIYLTFLFILLGKFLSFEIFPLLMYMQICRPLIL